MSDFPKDSESLKFPEWDNRNQCPKKDHVRNTEALLRYYGVWPVRYNLMVHDLEVTVPGRKMAVERTANYTVDFVENRAAEHELSRGPIIKHIKELAQEYHPVLEWIEAKPWDGVDRMPELFATVELAAGADLGFSGLLIHRWMLGAAASLLPELEQKFMAQGVLVAQGPQGRGKTRWLRSLVPNKNWVMSGEFIDPNNRDVTQRVTSVWLCELGEVDAVFRKADIAALKAFITRPDDVYRSAYDRRPERVIRRTVFFASVNEAEYLVDKTGNRRWWTIPVERCHPDHNVDMQQLWAQLVAEVRAGAPWWLSEDECDRLNVANKAHEQEDVLTSMVADTWEPLLGQADLFGKSCWHSLHKICEALAPFASRLPTQAETNRLGAVLRELGFQKKRDKNGYVYLARRLAS